MNRFFISLKITRNSLKGILNIKNIINLLLYSLPFLLFIFIYKGNNCFNILTLLYILLLIFIHYKNILVELFFSEDYEIFLGFPLTIKDIFLSKFLKLNITIFINNIYIYIAYIFLGIISKEKITYFFNSLFFILSINLIFIIISYAFSFVILNIKTSKSLIKKLLFILIIFLGIVLIYSTNLYKVLLLDINETLVLCSIFIESLIISTLIITFTINSYTNLIFNLQNTTPKKSKNKILFKQNKILYNLIANDLKKIFRDNIFRNSVLIGLCIFSIFSILSISFTSKVLRINIILVILVIHSQVSCIANIASSIGFSKDSYDLELVLSLPIELTDYIHSKIISVIIINTPWLLLLSFFLLTLDINLILKLLIISAMLFTTISFSILGLSIDIKHINLSWFNKKDLVEDYNKLFKQFIYSFITTMPLFLLTILFKNSNFLFIYFIIQAINTYISIKSYLNIKKYLPNLFLVR